MKLPLAVALLSVPAALAQTASPLPTQAPAQTPTITASTTLVLVPALVQTRAGEPVFTLTADDFTVTDDGIEQKATVDADTGEQPLALVVAIETGGAGAHELDRYRNLAPLIEALVGSVEHRIAVVAFDSVPTLVQDFTSDFEAVGNTIRDLHEGKSGGAILDSLAFSVDLLRRQPPQYRRAILLLSETNDRGSQTSLEDALHAIGDTNTAIYSLGYSSAHADVKNQGSLVFQPNTPGPPGGCMAKDPSADPGTGGSRLNQFYDCLSLLAPPLRLAKMAAIAGMDGLRRNVPETVAQLTGGEYFKLTDARSLERDLVVIGRHLPNRYLLSFHPQSPHPGLHALGLRLKEHPDLVVTARNSYWADSVGAVAGSR
jgi:VWFA-related protein